MPPTRTAQKSIHRDTYIYKQIGANAIELDVIGIRSDMTQPCVVWIHGGGLIFGWRKTSPRESFLRSLIERGFVIISIDHRLAPETRLPAIIEDVQDAWAWIHQFAVPRLGIDPMRLAMAGASSGGYLALLAGYLFDPRPRALASLWGFGDITGAWEAEPSQHYRQMALVTRQEAEASLCGPVFDEVGVDRSSFYLYCRQQGRWLQEVTGHDPAKTPRWFDRYCPIRNVNRTFPPTILVHGDADTDVPHEESARLAARFGEAEVRHRFISLNAVGHGFENASPALAETVEREVADFLITALA